MTDVPPEPGTVIEFIERDHKIIRGILGRFDMTEEEEWGGLFRELRDYLVRHEIAEEQVVFPRVRTELPSSSGTLDECIAEQHAAEQELIRLSRVPPVGQDFREAIGRLKDDLDAHIARENLVVIPMIRSLGSYEDPEFAQAYEVARAVAPSRPEAVAEVGEESSERPFEHVLGALKRVVGRD